MHRNIHTTHLIQYGCLAIPLAFAGLPLYIHAPNFYAIQHHVPLSALAFILLILRFFDAIQDPVIGRLSDLYSKKRFIFIGAASIILSLSFLLLFHPLAKKSPFIWFTLCLLFATTAFSIISINLNTIGGLWSTNTHEKTTITSYREALGLIGLLLAVLMPALLQQHFTLWNTFSLISYFLIALTGLSLFLFYHWWKKNNLRINHHYQTKQKTSLIMLYKKVTRHQKSFYLIYFLSMLASSIPAILILFFIRDRLNAEPYTGLFLLLYFLSAALAMPFWQKLSRQYGKQQAWLLAMLVAISSFFWAIFLNAGDIWQYALICFISGSAFSADLNITTSLLSDYIQDNHSETTASVQFGLLGFLAKFALALASLVALGLLDILGFSAGQYNEPDILLYLSLIYALIPCLIKIIAAYLLWKQIQSNPMRRSHENTPHKISHHSCHTTHSRHPHV